MRQRVTRYGIVSRDNAGMQGEENRRIRARRSGLRGANTFSYFARGRIDAHTCVTYTHFGGDWLSLILSFSLSHFSFIQLHPGTHYLQGALITPPLPLALARLIRVLLDKSSPCDNKYTDRPGPLPHGSQTIRQPRSVINHVNPRSKGRTSVTKRLLITVIGKELLRRSKGFSYTRAFAVDRNF